MVVDDGSRERVHVPADPRFRFEDFYDGLRQRGYVIYPGKLTVAESFRIGCIGRLGEAQMRGALVAVEDKNFYGHAGVDFRGVIRAAWRNLTTMSPMQGASTLTQQLARNLFLTREKTIRRKLAEAVLAIYAHGLATRNATFETRAPDWRQWDAKHHPFCRLVFEQDGRVAGWVALAPMSPRDCYRGVAEISVYVAEGFEGRRIGTRLLEKAVEVSEEHGIWTLFASVFPENKATLRLHFGRGFRELGVRERVAQLDGVWRDTVILERRSGRVGVD